MKKIYICLIVAVLQSFCAISAIAQSVTINEITYSLFGDSVVVDDAHDAIVAAEILPFVTFDEIEYPVKVIRGWAFSGCNELTSVTIPQGITEIGNYAFDFCRKLTTVKTPVSLVTIGLGAFGGCSSLTSFTIPEGVTLIDDYTFSGCSGLASITIPEGVTSIGQSAFSDCSSLTSITIPEGVTSIGQSAFSDCSSLTSITIPEGVTSIGQSAFSDCSSLTSITISEGVISIGANAFDCCKSISSITIPKSVTSIGMYAFYSCINLSSIAFSEGLTSIGEAAFGNCGSLASIVIPGSVSSIGDRAFSGCANLSSVSMLEGVKSIGNSAFAYCSSLAYVTLPQSVESIGRSAFDRCHGLISVNIPEGITSIEESTFFACGSLQSITLPDSLTSIGNNAFWGCSSLYSVKIPDGVTSIGDDAFYGCYNIVSVKISDGVTSIGNNAFWGCSSLYSVKIPEGVTSINDYVFNGCFSLTSVTIPKSVKSIGNGSFSGCNRLGNISLPDSLISIGRAAFSHNSDRTSIVIPESVTEIGDRAFESCGITSIFIPKGVTSIGEAVFTGCELVDSIVVAADNPVYDSRGGCNAVIETKTNTLRIGGPLTIIPEGIISISSYAYIKSPHYAVVIPESVTSIGEKAMFFQRDQFVLCRAKNPPALSDSSFVRVPKEGVDNFYNSYAYVPEGTMSEYQSSEWSSFFSNIEEVAGQAIATGKCNGNLTWKLTVSGEFIVEGEGDLLEMDVHFDDFESIMNSIIIKHGVTSIGAALFEQINPYYSLLTISLPETLTSIGEKAFYHSKFGSVTLPESLVSIGNEALCCNPFAATLPTIFIPKNVKSIGVRPFIVDSIFIDEANKYFYVHDYAIIEKNSGTLIRASNSTRTIPEGVNTIGHSAFWGNPISSIVIPESVTSIETWAFSGSELESVTFSKNLISIGDVAFENCGISSIDLPESLTSIGNNAFKAIPITSIFIPKNVKSIGNSPFMYCDKLESIVVDEDNEYYDSRNGCNAILKTISNKLISGCKSTIIPEGTDSISVEAFAGCYNLTSIVIPEGVTSIGDRVFLECYNLTSVVMPESVTSLGLLMFYSCNNLSSVNIPKGVTSIPAATFQYCGALSSFTIPEWVTSVGSKAFESCGGLKSINFPKGGINIGPEAFSGCYSLTSVELPEGETNIGAEAFRSCSSLNSVVISEGVTNIESEAFSNCSGLATVVLPSSLPAMQKDLFVKCDSLSSIICYADTPLVLSSEGFLGGLDRSKCTLYVPSASIDDYKNAAYWNTFARIAEISTSVTYIVDNEVYYTMAAARGDSLYLIDEPVKEGYSFSGWSRLPAIMPMYNVTVIGTFTPNMYKITYEIDGVLETRIDSLACDDIFVIPWEGPKGVGFTFSGWSGVPEKMPPHDIVLTGTTTHNRHKITFVVDEEIYSVDSAYYNANISFYFPTKRGHTFIANDSVPETMPDHDLTIEGTFVANVYKLTFMIDGEVYATDSLLCDAPIVAPELPVREGHFASWDNIPATMPDMDWVIRAVYVKEQYYVTFVLDGETIYSKLQVYDSDIVAPVVPEKEGYTFSGWGDVDATVPAHDVIYEGNYIVNTYKVYYYVGEELVHTDEVAFGEVIPEYTYEPTDGGYTFLGWAGEIYVTMPAHDVKYTANTINSIGQLTIDASKCIIYDLNGNRITDVDNLKRGIYIVNGKKVMIK